MQVKDVMSRKVVISRSLNTPTSWHDPIKTEVKEIVTPGVTYCFENQSIEEAAELMQANRLRRLLVLNQQKKVAGILSIGDLAAKTDADQVVGKTVKGVSL